MSNHMFTLASAMLLPFTFLAPAAQSADEKFASFSFTSPTGLEMPYRLHSPGFDADSKIPLVIYLHGSGGSGTDNVRQISGGNAHGTQLWLKPEIAEENPAYVLAPQIPQQQRWSAANSDELSSYAKVLIELIEQIKSDYSIDANRIYIMGQSLGGMGVWDIVSKHPEMFAAGVPICGVGNTERIVNARNVPLWAFHGAQDTTVPVSGSQDMVASLKAVNGDIRYTEYPEVRHNSWERAFADPQLPKWLFSNTLD